MPELPEVEVLRRSLEPLIVGKSITRIEVSNHQLREPVDSALLSRAMVGHTIRQLRRRAKYLLLDLEHDWTVAVHLGMSGRLTLAPATTEQEPHEHVSVTLETGHRLRLRDPRRFGLILAVPSSELEQDRHFVHLGLEPLGDGLSGVELKKRARFRRAPVKNFLMDGTVVVGLGNIYSTEALHRAGIHPRRSVARIAAARWQRLADAVQETLDDAIRQGGTTLNDFTDGEGQEGFFQVSLAVYGREGKPCAHCGTAIRRIVQGGRSTFYCPRCQR